jgi:hypothetical protein
VDWTNTRLENFEKNFYAEDRRVTARSDREVEEFRRSKEIKIQGRNVPRPITAFEETGFPQYLLTSIRAQGFSGPTPIQCQAWPMALSGRDVVAIAQTGSGKTIAFALPAMLHINASALPFYLKFSILIIFQTTLACSWRWPYRSYPCPYSRACRPNPTRMYKVWVRSPGDFSLLSHSFFASSLDPTLVFAILLSTEEHQRAPKSVIYSEAWK